MLGKVYGSDIGVPNRNHLYIGPMSPSGLTASGMRTLPESYTYWMMSSPESTL